MSKENFINLVHRYLAGECTQDEIDWVKQWIRENPNNQQTYDEIKKIWEVTPDKELHANLGDAWGRLEQKIERKEKFQYLHNKNIHIAKSNEWIRVAAILVVVMLLSLFSIHFSGLGNFSDEAFTEREEVSMQEVRADRGHQSRMTFSDGSEVRLNAASLIRFPRQFKSNIREVYLEGEAWFNVEHNPDVEFVVHTPSATVRVLGTEFNVKAYSGEPEVEIVVAEGMVAVQAAAADNTPPSEVLLKKGEMSRVIRGEEITPAREVNIESHISWISGTFVFEETPFTKVLAEWERRFNVDFEIHDEDLMNTPFTGEFRYESFEEMLRLTSITLGFEYNRINSTIAIIR